MAVFFRALMDARGNRLSARDITEKHDLEYITRFDREIKKLPSELRELIESDTKGYCMVPW